MKGLRVKEQLVECDRLGNPMVDSFLELLLPDPAGRADRKKARKATAFDYIYDLQDFVKAVAKKIGTEEKHIWDVLSFDSPIRESKKRKPMHRIILHDNISFSSEEPQDDYPDEDDIEEEIEEDIEEKEPQEERNLEVNCQVLSSLALLMGQTNPDTEYEYYSLLKDTSLPFIKAIKQHGPYFSSQQNPKGKISPEKPGEVSFGVSQRVEQLKLNLPAGKIAQVGKRALELYRQVYPGFSPPQRTVKNDHGHEYLMNQYTPTTTQKTLDVAIKEEIKRQKK
jgi:hypothetical protein